MLRYLSALGAILLGLCATAVAGEDKGSFISVARAVSPPVQGLEVEIIGGDETVELRNRGRLLVLVEGYDGEPYLRFKPNGVVERNERSPATYLNADRRGQQAIPGSAKPRAAPSWKAVSNDGEFRWFDHRTHVTTETIPRRLRKATARKKIFDWRIPISAAGASGEIKGTLYWNPTSSSSGSSDSDGFPIGLLIAGVGVVLLLTLAGLVISRRRPRRTRGDTSSTEEAW